MARKMPQKISIVVERHVEGFVAYPVNVRGVIVGEGDTAIEALQNVLSAIEFHCETFGASIFDETKTIS